MGYLDCHYPGCGGLVDTSDPETNVRFEVGRRGLEKGYDELYLSDVIACCTKCGRSYEIFVEAEIETKVTGMQRRDYPEDEL